MAPVETPMMKQYNEIKREHPEAILLFRVGDFYETFSTDAIKTSEALGITLTKRANGAAQFVELAGFPHHALDTYLPKLVRAGFRVAICDQLEDPKATKKIVKRGITELVTPGVSTHENVIELKENNFLAAVHISKDKAGISFLDISTGEFLVSEGSFGDIEKLINSFQPKEILYESNKKITFEANFGTKHFVFRQDDWIYTKEAANERLLKHFETANLKGFGIEDMPLGIIAAGAVMYYLDHTKHNLTSHINSISRVDEKKFVWLDKFTMRNLEIFGSAHQSGTKLIDVLDKCITPMGSRLMRRWCAFPLKDTKQINERLDAVDQFFKQPDLADNIANELHSVGDVERLLSKLAVGRINPREVAQLATSIKAIKPIKEAISNTDNHTLKVFGSKLEPCEEILNQILVTISENPPIALVKGGCIAEGFCAELDELRSLAFGGKDSLAGIQKRESERTGITSLKISFNNVFGYYIEVTNSHKDKVPAEWVRKQTLVNAERYITEELKEYEEKILGAEEKILAIETRLFNELIVAISKELAPLQKNSHILSQIDCLLSFATISKANRYFRPIVDNDNTISISSGRHPVIEKQLPIGEKYVPNDVLLNSDNQQIIIITGPNMSGKSALLRQTALIVLMAQIGCFVPADAARIGAVDKIFTRVGASDNISQGESTFMVEMNEAASILHNLTDRSLVLFDELGRGTSTYDGISIAWAIVEYIHNNPNKKAKTLFATHYHELNELESSCERVKNFHVSIKEIDNRVLFLRKLQRGGSEHSFGIHVARMAGLPKQITGRADEILAALESTHEKGIGNQTEEDKGKKTKIKSNKPNMQLSIFQLDDPVLEQIRDEIINVDINSLTPLEALNKISEIQKILGK